MKSYKESQIETKRQQVLDRLEKREGSVLLTKSNINSTFSRLTDNFNSRLEYAKSRIYQQTEVLIILKQECEKDRNDLHDRIMQKCKLNIKNN